MAAVPRLLPRLPVLKSLFFSQALFKASWGEGGVGVRGGMGGWC